MERIGRKQVCSHGRVDLQMERMSIYYSYTSSCSVGSIDITTFRIVKFWLFKQGRIQRRDISNRLTKARRGCDDFSMMLQSYSHHLKWIQDEGIWKQGNLSYANVIISNRDHRSSLIQYAQTYVFSKQNHYVFVSNCTL